MSALDIAGMSKRFGGVQAVDDVSFSLKDGEMLALIGPNGAGKSTCFNIISGYIKPDAGTVLQGGQNLIGLPPRKIWRRGIGRTFQITATFASMQVIENVQMALIAYNRESFSLTRPAAKRYRDDAFKLLERVSLGDQAEQPCAALAYGDLKRLELAIALAHQPRILLMDEPTAGMAQGERNALMALVAAIARDDRVSVLFTEHDMDVVFAHADRIIVLNRGQLIAEGSAESIRSNPLVRDVYLGGGRQPGQLADA